MFCSMFFCVIRKFNCKFALILFFCTNIMNNVKQMNVITIKKKYIS